MPRLKEQRTQGDEMRIAIVTGASSGMGRDFVKAIDQQFRPDQIWVIARREDRLSALQNDSKAQIVPLALDLSQESSIQEVSDRLKKEKPQVQVLVNAAGYGLFGTFDQMDRKNQSGIARLNDMALTDMCHICIPYMAKGSKIINLGSNSSWQPVPYMAVYAASKAYVLSFSRSLGVELKHKGIQVMCVCPGWIKTEFFDTAVHDDTIKYYDRFYTSQQVVDRAMKDLRKGKAVSILGFPVRMQVRLVKLLPVKMVMKTWCRQQGK